MSTRKLNVQSFGADYKVSRVSTRQWLTSPRPDLHREVAQRGNQNEKSIPRRCQGCVVCAQDCSAFVCRPSPRLSPRLWRSSSSAMQLVHLLPNYPARGISICVWTRRNRIVGIQGAQKGIDSAVARRMSTALDLGTYIINIYEKSFNQHLHAHLSKIRDPISFTKTSHQSVFITIKS